MIIIRQLVDDHDISITGGHHESKYNRGNESHCIHITMSKEGVVIKLGIDNLNVNQQGFFG